MGWTKIPKEHHPIFEAALPRDERVTAMKMFGGVAGIVNGHMFSGLWAETVAVRLGEKDRETVLTLDGGEPFDPMGRGKPMAEMVLLPPEVLSDGAGLRRWLRKAFDYTAALPPKKKASKKSASSQAASSNAGSPKRASAKKASAKKTSASQTAASKKAAKKASAGAGSGKKASARR